ncbi:lipase 3-like [Diorhabda carinulata]|uniref:lipase 3-like n=1 Tax=Diorhabda carinulata TaxID=1163345 RepID=UPI0025A2F6AB|nr:lipase 3-like [Diorhabda carinulata]
MRLIFGITFVTIFVDFGVKSNFINDIEKFVKSDQQYQEIAEKSFKQVIEEQGKDIVSQAFEFGEISTERLPEIVNRYGYPLESYYVTTEDGYILNIFRIPYGKTGKKIGKVVLLQHGLFLASTDYVLFGPQQGLAYILADNGYDVWMMNCRGNIYSRNHTTFDPDKDKEFWMYSWHEIGIYDTPRAIDFVLEKTGNKTLYHIGHSQGTTAFYVMASMKPEYNEKIEHHISLAPIAFMQHLYSPVMRIMSPSAFLIGETMDSLGQFEFIPNKGPLKDIMSGLCSESLGTVLCKNFLFLAAGFTPNQINASAMPIIFGHYPAGESTRQVLHYCQEYNSGKFAQYDFGLIKNMATYKRISPPEYDLSQISTPISIIYSSNDWLSATIDVEKLAKMLPNLKLDYLVPIPTWSHLDFVFGNDAPSVIYTKVLEILSTY